MLNMERGRLRVGQKLLVVLGTMLGLLLYIFVEVPMWPAVVVALIFIVGGYLTLKYGGGHEGRLTPRGYVLVAVSVLLAGAGPIIFLYFLKMIPSPVWENSLIISVFMSVGLVLMLFSYTPE